MRVSLLGLIFLVLSQPVWAAAKIEHWQTAHGSRVYFVRTEGLPLVDIEVAFDAGSARDGKQFGLSALTSGMLDTGAGSWNADDIAQRFESVGASMSTGISQDIAWLSLRTLTQKPMLDTALETLQTILAKPRFAEEDFKREKSRTLSGIKQREESPGQLANIAFYRALYGDHPYGHPASGVKETVQPLKAEDLRRFYKTYYVAANAVVAIVGDVTREQAEKIAEQLLGGVPAGQKPEPIPEVAMPAKAVAQDIQFPSSQTHVLAGVPGTYRGDKDYFSLYVGNHILGGSGLVSKLFEEVREKRGLAYSASSSLSPMLRKGPFVVGLQTRNDQTREALQVMNTTVSEFAGNGPSEAELTAAKKNITGGFAMRFDTNKELLNYVAVIGFYGLPLDYLDTFQHNIEQVTVDSIKQAFKDRIDLNVLQTVTVGGEGARAK